MNYNDACTLAARLKVKDFRCVHMSHKIPWDLPQIGKDGETFCFYEMVSDETSGA